MTLAEAIETTRLRNVAGLTGDRMAFVTTRRIRAPHHTIPDAGPIGGGQVPMSGEMSLAHNGVLFVDELPEFRRHFWKPGVSPSRTAAHEYNLGGVIDLAALVTLAGWMMTAPGT
jgi:hypothetical protein